MEPTPKSAELCADRLELAALMRSIAGGDERAFTALFDRTSRQVYGLLRRMIADTASAEEVLLDAYAQAWRQRCQYDESRGTPLAWLFTIARSRALDRLRAARAEHAQLQAVTSASQRAETADIEEAAAAHEEDRRIRSALDALPAEQREVIELAYFGGMSHGEIALRTGQPLGTVKTRMRLAMVKLRDLLRESNKAS